MRQGVFLAILVAVALAVGAARINGHTRDWRDGLPGAAVPVVTGPITLSESAGGPDRIDADQARLAADFTGMKPGAESPTTTAIRDTSKLIADLEAFSISATRRAHELHEALRVVDDGRCAHCARMLHAAAGPQADASAAP
jgi:hypothetical protein